MNSCHSRRLKMVPLLAMALMYRTTSVQADVVQSIPSTITDRPVYYPLAPQTPMRVGDENYQKNYTTLRGLTGLYVNVDDVIAGAELRKQGLRTDLKDEITRRLNKAGMRLLTKDEMERTPGQPELSMYLTYPKYLGPFGSNEPNVPYRPDCCTTSIWTSFAQGTSLLRYPVIRTKQATWGEGNVTDDCSDISGWVTNAVLKALDDFISDKMRNDRERLDEKLMQPVVPATAITPAATGNMECNTSLMMYIELFASGASTISQSKHFVLDKLAEAINSCPSYNYVIETHADQRADSSFNDRLTKERAEAIRSYLRSKGVNTGRFEMKSFGSSRLVTTGMTEEDYSANRRVVVTPYKVQSIPK